MPGVFLGALVGAEARSQSALCGPAAGSGRPLGRWVDRPCGISGLLSFWPLGRCRAGRVIPSVGGVPGVTGVTDRENEDEAVMRFRMLAVIAGVVAVAALGVALATGRPAALGTSAHGTGARG